ncbi:hypothetical protein [Paenibacillus eucommiae]|nr:hypothetical protein [Paenibacillus eucommiae]
MGFDLAKEYWRKGIMQETLKPVIAFVFKRPLRSLQLVI